MIGVKLGGIQARMNEVVEKRCPYYVFTRHCTDLSQVALKVFLGDPLCGCANSSVGLHAPMMQLVAQLHGLSR